MACDAATVANKASVGVVHHSRLQTAADQLLHAAMDEPALGLALQDYAWAASSDAKDLAVARLRALRKQVPSPPAKILGGGPPKRCVNREADFEQDSRAAQDGRGPQAAAAHDVGAAAGLLGSWARARARERRGKQANGVIERATLSRVHKDAWLGLAYLLLVATPGRFQLD